MKKLIGLLVLFVMAFIVGCKEPVPQGRLGRVKTRDGWQDEVLLPGYHSCWGWDEMFTIDNTEQKYDETMRILVGGKVNLEVTVSTRCAVGQLTDDNKEKILNIFESIKADENNHISANAVYRKTLQIVVQSAPREIIGVQPDVQTVAANKTDIANAVRKRVIERSSETPMNVLSVEITNWDWPKTITKAQEELVGIQLEEERQKARTRASLAKAQGELKIAEAQMLVEVKRAEAVARSNEIIGESLKNNPEYLQWHTVRAMSEAALGPNNAFILFPYNLPGEEMQNDVNRMAQNAQLKQLLDKD